MPAATETERCEAAWVDLFRRTAVESAEAATAADIGGWLYRFDLPSTVAGGVLGATHASEIAFTFNWYGSDDEMGIAFHERADETVRDLARRWSDTVIAFARTGDPNGAGLPLWPQYESERRACLILDTECRVEDDPDKVRRALWT